MPRNPRSQLAFVLAAIGSGLLLFGALKWHRLPHYSEADITASIELNLGLDVARLGPAHAPSPEQLAIMRRAIQDEVSTEITHERETAQAWLTGGAVLLAIALAQFLTQRYLARQRTATGPR